MTREEAITNLEMIRIGFVVPITEEQEKLIDDTFFMAIKALEQEQKTGHWIEDEYEMAVRCSACGEENDKCSNYCPNCGAKMESEEQNENSVRTI